MSERRKCPDDGTCHHDCARACYRVLSCAPLSAFADSWPVEIRQRHLLLHVGDEVDRVSAEVAAAMQRLATAARTAAAACHPYGVSTADPDGSTGEVCDDSSTGSATSATASTGRG